jgi:hypothetical protein
LKKPLLPIKFGVEFNTLGVIRWPMEKLLRTILVQICYDLTGIPELPVELLDRISLNLLIDQAIHELLKKG